ncbi:hypothetical protein Salat_2838800 [Sesamum alatum]|uniref:Uncharacterized protein n=1 Tax=Sesamum alatum TaxID=300844 RepID=A0AAE2C9R9_9LAMI|nr:hypothetical protein Salat_2838800 [Sesamum alatum]
MVGILGQLKRGLNVTGDEDAGMMMPDEVWHWDSGQYQLCLVERVLTSRSYNFEGMCWSQPTWVVPGIGVGQISPPRRGLSQNPGSPQRPSATQASARLRPSLGEDWVHLLRCPVFRRERGIDEARTSLALSTLRVGRPILPLKGVSWDPKVEHGRRITQWQAMAGESFQATLQTRNP